MNPNHIDTNSISTIFLKSFISKVMHALGWWHEQQRGDRDEHVMVWPDRCYWSRSSFDLNFGKISWQNQGSPYDTASVMHYSTDACASRAAEHTITKPDGSPLVLSKTSSLSRQDIWQINQIYNCGMTTTQAPTTQSTKPPDGGKLNFILQIFYEIFIEIF